MTDPDRHAAREPGQLQLVGRPESFVGGTAASLRSIWSYRELLGMLVRRELKVRYKDSVLGLLWSMLRPLALLLVYYVAIGQFLGAERAIPDFAVYVFTGLTAWALFSEIVTGGAGSIVGNAGLVKKVFLPREVFPLSVVGSALVNTVIQVGLLVAATLVLGRFPVGERWLYAPLSIAVVVVFGTALGLVVAALNVYLRDVQYLVEVGLLIGFWATPVVYSYELLRGVLGESLALQLYTYNPITAAVLGLQRTFWVSGDGRPTPDNLGLTLLVMLGIGLVLVWLAQRVFVRLEGDFAQEL